MGLIGVMLIVEDRQYIREFVFDLWTVYFSGLDYIQVLLRHRVVINDV